MSVHLCFHGIGTCGTEREPGESRYWVTEDFFLRVLDEVTDAPDMHISFDDGNRTDVEIGLPALTDRCLRATFFVLAGRLDDPASVNPADLIGLAGAGMSIGNHGWNHVPWRALTVAQADREMKTARDVLAEVSKTRVCEAAFPLGRYDRESLKRLRALDYEHVYSSDRYAAHDTSWLRPRYSLTATDTIDDVRRIVRGRARLTQARNRAASLVKRMR